MEASAVARHEIPEQVSAEDQARAAIYGLISNLFYAPPGKQLLTTVADADSISARGEDSELGRTWRALQEAAALADESAVQQEFDDAFVSTGRAPVFLYGSFYLAGFLMEKPVVRLREDLAALGLARRPGSHESEDHISALCDVMRMLILGDDEAMPPAEVRVQREFFARNIQPWYARLAEAIENDATTVFYKPVAAFMKAFLDLESQSFEMA